MNANFVATVRMYTNPPSSMLLSLQLMSDDSGEDRFVTHIGVGGLINLDKLRQAHIVLNDIHLFHHHAALQRLTQQRLEEEEDLE